MKSVLFPCQFKYLSGGTTHVLKCFYARVSPHPLPQVRTLDQRTWEYASIGSWLISLRIIGSGDQIGWQWKVGKSHPVWTRPSHCTVYSYILSTLNSVFGLRGTSVSFSVPILTDIWVYLPKILPTDWTVKGPIWTYSGWSGINKSCLHAPVDIWGVHIEMFWILRKNWCSLAFPKQKYIPIW